MTKKPYTTDDFLRLSAVAFKPSYAEPGSLKARIVFVTDAGQQIDMPARSKVAREAVAMTGDGTLLRLRAHNFVVVCEHIEGKPRSNDLPDLRAVAVHSYPQWPATFSTAFLPERQRELKEQKELVLKIVVNPETYAYTVLEYPQTLLRAPQVQSVLLALDNMSRLATNDAVGNVGKIISFEEGVLRVRYTGKVAQAAGAPTTPEFAEDTSA